MPTHDEIVAWIQGRTARELVSLLEALEEAFELRLRSDAPRELSIGGFQTMGPPVEDRGVDVILVDPGPDRVAVLRAVKNRLGWPLVSAKALIERCPTTLVEGRDREEAEGWVRELESLGAKVILR